MRSALYHLEQEDFIAAVEIGRDRRLIVASLTVGDGVEVFTIVVHLEGQAATRGSTNRFFELDIEFHRLYVDDMVGRRATSVREHARITAAIARGELDAAQHAEENNWRNAADRLADLITQLGARGSW